MKTDLTWYKGAIKARDEGRQLPDIDANTAHGGFYFRKASKAGGRVPVRIQMDASGELVAISGTKAEYRIEDAANVWTWVASNVVARDDYVFAWENDRWPNGSPVTAPNAPAPIGDNRPSDPFEALKFDLDDALEKSSSFLSDAKAPLDKNRADMARNLQAQLLDINKRADTLHKTEKQPHLDASREVDAKFRFRDEVKDIAGQLRRVFEKFMQAEEARQRAEAQKRFEEERAKAEAERKRIEAERADKMKVDPIAALTDPEPELPEIPTGPVEVKVNVGGGIGRSAGLKTVYEHEIDDYAAALAHFANHDEVVAAVEKLIKAAVRANKAQTSIPGVKVHAARRAA